MAASNPSNRGADAADLRAQLVRVVAQHQSGDLSSAIRGYNQVLAAAPGHFDALRLLGVALRGQGRLEEAVSLFHRALAVRSDFEEVWMHLADTLLQLGQPAAAAAALSDLGMRLLAGARFESALHAFDKALALAPDSAACASNRGLALDAMKRPAEALAQFDRALQRDGRMPEIWCNRGKILLDLGRAQESLASIDQAIALAPRMLDAWIARAGALRRAGRLEEAAQACQRAVEIDAGSPAAWTALGALLTESGALEDASRSLDRALALAPGYRQARMNRALIHLALGDLAAGWEGYEARNALASIPWLPDVPVWEAGQPLPGRSIVLHCEQGLGDTIQFCRYAPLLAKSAARVSIVVQPELQRILADSFTDGIDVLAKGNALPASDLQCSLLSVPHRVGTRVDSVPSTTPYLVADGARQRCWQDKLGISGSQMGKTSRRRLGLVCSGSATHVNDGNRSIPLAAFGPCIERLRSHACEWHLLQDAVRPADEPWLRRLGIITHDGQLPDFAETAALMRCMDAVISVDTAAAHLAGALNVPLLLLLPRNPDWRWMLQRRDSPWYPSATLFRQTAWGVWDEAIAEVAETLSRSFAPAVPG